MRSLPALAAGERANARRWDAVVLGGALPGLVASVVLGMRGARVLVLEEAAALQSFPGRREPFFMPPARSAGILGACLGSLGIPLIERRRIAAEGIAYQIVLPDARLDWGEPARTIDELVAWGLAKPESAGALVRALARGGEAERDALLGAPLVRSGRRREKPRLAPGQAARTGDEGARVRGLPPEWSTAPAPLAAVLSAQVRALSNLADAEPPPPARVRLLAAALEGGGRFKHGDPWLRTLLRQRIHSLHGEFRSLTGAPQLVAVGGQPGVTAQESRDVCVGRVLILNAPRAALSERGGERSAPALLRGPKPTHRRLGLHFRVPERALPEGMAPRVICLSDPGAAPGGIPVTALRLVRGTEGTADVLAEAVVPAAEADSPARAAEIEAIVAGLMPFAAGLLQRQPSPQARWDVDDLLVDPPRGSGWPADTDLRLASRPPVYALERSGVAALGVEGELLLGWRAGDTIAGELS